MTLAKKSHVKSNQKNKTIPTSTASAEKDILLPNTRRSLRLMSLKKKEPDPHLDFTSEEEKNNSTSSEVNLSSEEDSQDDDFKPQGRNRQRQAALKSEGYLYRHKKLNTTLIYLYMDIL